MMKKILKKLGKLLKWMVIIFLLFCVIMDISTSTVYYYAHSKFTDKRRLPAVIVDNLTDIVNQNNREDFENFSFDFDGYNTVFYNIKNSEIKIAFSSKHEHSSVYTMDIIISNNLDSGQLEERYIFDENFQFKEGFTYKNDIPSGEPTDNDLKKVKTYLSEMSDKLLENYDPLINYQWFYDVLFTDRTVDKYD